MQISIKKTPSRTSHFQLLLKGLQFCYHVLNKRQICNTMNFFKHNKIASNLDIKTGIAVLYQTEYFSAFTVWLPFVRRQHLEVGLLSKIQLKRLNAKGGRIFLFIFRKILALAPIFPFYSEGNFGTFSKCIYYHSVLKSLWWVKPIACVENWHTMNYLSRVKIRIVKFSSFQSVFKDAISELIPEPSAWKK